MLVGCSHFTPIRRKSQYTYQTYYKILINGGVHMYRIRDLREDRDLTQAQIAKILKTTQQQYSKIETGRADISGEKLILLARF